MAKATSKTITTNAVLKEYGAKSSIDIHYQIKTLDIAEIVNLRPLSDISGEYIRQRVKPIRAKELAKALIMDVSNKNVKHNFEIQVLESLIIWENPEEEENQNKYVVSGNTRRAALIHLYEKYKDNENYKFLPVPYKKLKNKKPPTSYQILKIQTSTNDNTKAHTAMELAMQILKTSKQLEEKYSDFKLENGKDFSPDQFLIEIFDISKASLSKYRNLVRIPQFLKDKIEEDEIAPFSAEKLWMKCKSLEIDTEETFRLISEIYPGKVSKLKIDKYFKEHHEKLVNPLITEAEEAKEFVGAEITHDVDSIDENQLTNVTEEDLPDLSVSDGDFEEAIEYENQLGFNENDTLVGKNTENSQLSNNTPIDRKSPIGKAPEEKSNTEITQDLFEVFDSIKKRLDEVDLQVNNKELGVEAFNDVSELSKALLTFMTDTVGAISNDEEVSLFSDIARLFQLRFCHNQANKSYIQKLLNSAGKKKFESFLYSTINASDNICGTEKDSKDSEDSEDSEDSKNTEVPEDFKNTDDSKNTEVETPKKEKIVSVDGTEIA